MYINKAIILGNLTRDPELKDLPTGVKVCSFSVATNRVWKDANGAKNEAVDFHNIVVFGKQAESSATYLKKGSQVEIEGRIQTRSWDDKDGKKQYRTEVVADVVQFGRQPTENKVEVKEEPKVPSKVTGTDMDYPTDDIAPEDIPF